jgi:hypothetical protein
MRGHRLLLLSEVEVPHLDRLVVGGRVEVLAGGVQGQTAHPVVVAGEGVQQFARLGQEELDQLVPTASEDEALEVPGDTAGSLLAQLLQRSHAHLGGELVLQELGVHELGAGLALDQKYSLDDVIMGEESQHWRFLAHIPDDYALIIRPANEGLPVPRD